ncbi:MAG TPA: hypothetical protein VF175_00405 [Lacipirellula sp.]
MAKLSAHVKQLAAADRWTYRASRQSATEPAAWAALALTAHGHVEAALRPARWLADLQQDSGAVGITANDLAPCWPTSLSLWCWAALDRAQGSSEFQQNIRAAAEWSLADRGKSAPQSSHIGHNTELVGWSWAADTHSWLEPTCMFVLGLRAAGHDAHPRVREGVQLIVDRLLPDGGANYGNTIVLGQPLVPHVQPTGLAMLALGGEPSSDSRISRSLDYLRTSIDPELASPSLAFAGLGLAAMGRRNAQSDQIIHDALDAPHAAEPLSTFEQALLLLALAPNAAMDGASAEPLGETL